MPRLFWHGSTAVHSHASPATAAAAAMAAVLLRGAVPAAAAASCANILSINMLTQASLERSSRHCSSTVDLYAANRVSGSTLKAQVSRGFSGQLLSVGCYSSCNSVAETILCNSNRSRQLASAHGASSCGAGTALDVAPESIQCSWTQLLLWM